MIWFITIAIFVLVGFILDREIYFYEGTHLGPRVQAWLYDQWAKKYDAGKHESQLRDQEMLAQPLSNALPLEVLELFLNMDEPLTELCRVLRSGGILLISRVTEASGRKARVKSNSEFGSLLKKYGFENFQITTWWKLFDRVIAVKNGSANPVSVRKLADVYQCPACGQIRWTKEVSLLRCGNCEKVLTITKAGILLGQGPFHQESPSHFTRR